MQWKYKIDLADETVFLDIEREYGIRVPEEVREIVRNYNAATPSQYHFMIGTDERAFGAVLSFNRGDEDVDLVFTALDVIEDKNLMPFAADPFGNYICFDRNEGKVAFWDHETNASSSTGQTMSAFLEDLY